MTICINGENADARGAKTIAELIDRLKVPPQTVMIEHNGVALHRHEWSQRAINQGDRIEFLRVVAGG